MLTDRLRVAGYEVLSFVENSIRIGTHAKSGMHFLDWVETTDAQSIFDYNTKAVMICDAVIYLAPSGKDAAAECGIAYAKGIPVLGLRAKGDDIGLTGKMMLAWFENVYELLLGLQTVTKHKG